MVIHREVHEETRSYYFNAFLRDLRDLCGKTVIMRCLHAVMKHGSFPDFLRTYRSANNIRKIIKKKLQQHIRS